MPSNTSIQALETLAIALVGDASLFTKAMREAIAATVAFATGVEQLSKSEREANAIMARAAAITAANLTPTEMLAKKLAELEKIYQQTTMSVKTYNREYARLHDQYDPATQQMQAQLLEKQDAALRKVAGEQREAASTTKALRTETERLNQEMARLNHLQSLPMGKGGISATTYNRGYADIESRRPAARAAAALPSLDPNAAYTRGMAQLNQARPHLTHDDYNAHLERLNALLPVSIAREAELARVRQSAVASIQATMPAMDRYRAGVVDLNVAHRMGHMTAEQHTAGIRALGQQYAEQMAAQISFIRNMRAMSMEMTIFVTGPLVALGAYAVHSFSVFDDAMTQSLAIMGKISPELRQQMDGVARAVSKESLQTPQDLAKAYYFLGSAGMTAAQQMKSLPVVAKFAAAAHVEAGRATELLVDAQKSLGLESKNEIVNMEGLARVSDVFAQAASMSNAKVEQFAQALTTKAGTATKMLNKDVEEAVAVLEVFADKGIKAQEGGEHYEMFVRDLQKSVQANKEVWKQLGIEVYNSDGKMRKFADIIQDMEGRFRGMSDEQQRSAVAALGFQDRAKVATMALIGSSAQMRIYEKANYERGKTDIIAAEQLKSFASQMQIVRNHMADSAATIGQTLIPVVKGLGVALQGTLDVLAKYPTATVVIGGLVAAFGPLLGASAAFMLAGRLLTPMLVGLAGAETAAAVGATALTAASTAGALALIGGIAYGAYKGMQALLGLNATFEKSEEVAKSWAEHTEKAFNKTVTSNIQLPDVDKRKEALEKQLEEEKKIYAQNAKDIQDQQIKINLTGTQALDFLPKFTRHLVSKSSIPGHEEMGILDQDMTELQKQADATTERISQLNKALAQTKQEADKKQSAKMPDLGIPAEAIKPLAEFTAAIQAKTAAMRNDTAATYEQIKAQFKLTDAQMAAQLVALTENKAEGQKKKSTDMIERLKQENEEFGNSTELMKANSQAKKDLAAADAHGAAVKAQFAAEGQEIIDPSKTAAETAAMQADFTKRRDAAMALAKAEHDAAEQRGQDAIAEAGKHDSNKQQEEIDKLTQKWNDQAAAIEENSRKHTAEANHFIAEQERKGQAMTKIEQFKLLAQAENADDAEQQKNIDKTIQKWQDKAATIGMATHAAEAYHLKQNKNLTDEQRKQLDVAAAVADQADAQKKLQRTLAGVNAVGVGTAQYMAMINSAEGAGKMGKGGGARRTRGSRGPRVSKARIAPRRGKAHPAQMGKKLTSDEEQLKALQTIAKNTEVKNSDVIKIQPANIA